MDRLVARREQEMAAATGVYVPPARVREPPSPAPDQVTAGVAPRVQTPPATLAPEPLLAPRVQTPPPATLAPDPWLAFMHVQTPPATLVPVVDPWVEDPDARNQNPDAWNQNPDVPVALSDGDHG